MVTICSTVTPLNKTVGGAVGLKVGSAMGRPTCLEPNSTEWLERRARLGSSVGIAVGNNDGALVG
jgi:hypothetical protein